MGKFVDFSVNERFLGRSARPAPNLGVGAIVSENSLGNVAFADGDQAPRTYFFGDTSMKLVKSLLLGSAAGLCRRCGAQAADLPVEEGGACRVRSRLLDLGAGFFYIPGTETCLRVGGRARAEYLYCEPLRPRQRCHRLPRSWPHPARRPHGDGLRPAAHVRPLRDHPQLGHAFGSPMPAGQSPRARISLRRSSSSAA